jgi:hypothetical protein
MAEYVYIDVGMNVSLPPVFRKWIASVGISSLYLIAVKLPGTCTRSVLRSFEIAAHIMTLSPPKQSTS